MFTTLRNAWKIPELRKKILFTLFVLMIYRLGACVPVPYVNVSELATYFSQQLSGTVLGLYNAMSGSAFSQATVFAIGISTHPLSLNFSPSPSPPWSVLPRRAAKKAGRRSSASPATPRSALLF